MKRLISSLNALFKRRQACLNSIKPLRSFTLITLCFAFYAPISHATDTPTFNALKNHPSPYLAMHAQDPVNWLDWSQDALKEAQIKNKPILISSGYFACHWCHVMQQENYLDLAAAKQMNQGFISVKLDRELHPDLDRYLIEFARQLTGRAGWPQHVVLTPQGYPFAAFGYLPNQNYLTTLKNIQQSWQTQSQNIESLAQQATKATQPKATSVLRPADFQTQLLQALTQNLDDLSGGLKGTSKFPESPLLIALLSFTSLPENIEEWLRFTLEQMQNQHLQDHVNGGFYRYTVDPEWQIPHFEKMGYDNALLAQIYFQAGQKFERADFIQTGKQTLSYMEEHLFDADLGLFASSQSALDLSGAEGGDYLFSKAQLEKKLSNKAFNYLKKAWRLDQIPPYDLGWHPLPTKQFWPQIKAALKTPVANIPRDSKHILSWNGLALSAYASAYQATQEPLYLQKANALAEQLSKLINSPNAPRAIDHKKAAIGLATLEDYAYIIRGLQDLNTVDHTQLTSDRLQTLNQTTQRLFLNAVGWQTNQDFLLPGQNRQAALMDDDIPSATAILECATADKGLTRNPLFNEALQQAPLTYSSYLQVLKCQNAHN
ncbi:MAG: thioredoxin domain-containing protein [Thiotrichales bacterium]|nr:thioredoxin domain-containing protein [Thiotrichales bacterium]